MTGPTNLIWKGNETIRAARAAIAARTEVEVHLPANLHHSLYVQLYPTAHPSRDEKVDVRGGAELLARVGRIRGLGELTELEQMVAETQARVRVVSPGPKVLITPATGHA